MLESQQGEGASIQSLPLFAAAPPVSETDPVAPENKVLSALEEIGPDTLTPRSALEALYRLKSLAEDL